MAELEQSS